jgi:hypothetical protein
MVMKPLPIILLISIVAVGSISRGQGNSLVVRRATIPNFLTDPIIFGNISKTDDVTTTLPSTFILTSPVTGQAVYWSPVICRLAAIKNGKKTPKFREIVAAGPHPLAISLGAIGKPKFFGFRLVDGRPEFLYTYGQLSIEESFAFSPDGRELKQSFKIVSNAIDGAYSLPENWRAFVTANNGRWGNNVLMLKKEELKEGFTITFHLDPSKLR